MLDIKSEKLQQFFLLAFTRELIKNSIPEGLVKLEVQEEVEKESVKEKVKDIIKESRTKPLAIKRLETITKQAFKPLPKPFVAQRPPRRLSIPSPRLPQRLQYLKPIPSGIEINLGKIDQFAKDPAVKIIECNGPNENIIVRVPQERQTAVVLTKEEIDEIIRAFAEGSKIPAEEGVFRVAVGRLLLSAIISDVVGTKFIIKKIIAPSPIAPGSGTPGTIPGTAPPANRLIPGRQFTPTV